MALVDQPGQQAWVGDDPGQSTAEADRSALERAARLLEPPDRHAVPPGVAAARRHAAFVAESLGHGWSAAPDPDLAEPRTADQEQAEIDREVRRSIVKQSAPDLARLLDELAERHTHRRAELLERRLRSDHLAAVAADRQASAIRRATEVRARSDELKHRTRGADTGDRTEDGTGEVPSDSG